MNERSARHKKIGEFLKLRREKLHESLAEVSGAVEIDLDTLHKIETGRVMPSEDILISLLSHFDVDEADAKKLLDIADYDKITDADEALRQVFMVVPFDTRVLHIDEAQVRAKKDSVTIEFTQDLSGAQSTSTVSKVGMSKAQAIELANAIRAAIAQSERPVQPKLLPMPKSQKNPK
ncbi:helix-turn-helix transcriptional regulator [Candidatus Saccharibacteria bacterium]|nr:helix-turn-helix transcriptional regulator [Candidatus Saccharibacteria bacterium]